MITFTELLSCDGTALYQCENGKTMFKSSGKLSVLIAYDGMIMLKLNDFEYGVNPKIEVTYDDQDPQFGYVFYFQKYPNGQWILKINQNGDSVFSCLNEKCYLKNKKVKFNKAQTQDKKVKCISSNKKTELLTEDNISKNEKNPSNSLLVDASKQLSKGLSLTGKIISSGAQSFGTYISKKVQPEKNVEVSDSTKNNIKLAAKTTGNFLTFTAAQVSNLFQLGKEVAQDVGSSFEKSQKGQQIQQNQYYDTVKEGAKTGVKVIANIYDGVVNAAYEIGSGVSKGATKVVGAKYGQDMEQATDGVIQGAGNIAKIIRVPKDEAVKHLK